MINIEQTEQGVIVNNKFCFTHSTEKQSDYFTLVLTCGEDVVYGIPQKEFINYPGEYQQDNMTIYCILSSDTTLNYIIKSVNTVFALVQDAKAVSADVFEDVTDVIALGDNVSNQLQKLDLQCNIISL